MKWIYHEHEAGVIYSLKTDRQPVIYMYLATNYLLARLISILKHKKNEEKASVSFR